MAYVAISQSPIHVRHTADPDYGQGHPLPPHASGQPVPPGYASGQPLPPGGPVDPGYGLPLPPVINGGPPAYPDQGLPPTYPVDPGYDLPTAPGVWPQPPRPEHPDNSLPPVPVLPSHPIYIPGEPNNDLPLEPGQVWPPLPPSVTGEVMCFIWIVGVGYRWIVIDADNQPEHPIAPPPLYPSHQPVPGGERPPHASGQPIRERPGRPSTQPIPEPPEAPPATP